MRDLLALATALTLAAGLLAPAAAEDRAPGGAAASVQPPPGAILFKLLRPDPAMSSERALGEAIREDAARPPERPAWQGEVQPDGSVKYGKGSASTTVYLKNPCPDGAPYHDPLPPPRPGRTRR